MEQNIFMSIEKLKKSYFRNIIFGAEDSLVSTVGVMFGMATATKDLKLIITSGLIVISVEALSMGAGAFLSESSAEEVYVDNDKEKPIISGILMFFSYFITGFITLAPYTILSIEQAKIVSVILALITLFILGFLPVKNIKSGLRMMIVGGLAVIIGAFIANFSKL